MFRDVLMLASSAAASYAWLSATVSPVVRSVHSLTARVRDTRAWRACALAAGGAVLWTVIGAGGMLLFMMLEPRIGLALLQSAWWFRGLAAGIVIWTLQAVATERLPRLGATFEVATALALTALADDDPATLARVEDLYRRNAVVPARRSGGVPRVPA